MKQFVLNLTLVVFSLLGVHAQQNGPDGATYKAGYSSLMKLGKDMHNALKPEQRKMIGPQPISIETDATPFVRLLHLPEEPRPVRGIWISAGFIDLVNNVAHAKAIDLKNPGYFGRYIAILAQESGTDALQPLPDHTNRAYWTEEVLNEQLSNFNSIAGVVVGIKLAHHYLGHYEKYKERLQDANGGSVPINSLLTRKEWEAAFEAGVRNALGAGCTIEGVIPFFEAFDQMKNRPAWAAYFIPEDLDFSRIRQEMERIQRRFFSGED